MPRDPQARVLPSSSRTILINCPVIATELEPTVTIDSGALRGARAGTLCHFHGVPFAQASRFAEPQPPRPWSGTRDATKHGPICPQPPFPLVGVMGPVPRVPFENEDCLTLSVTTPGLDDRRRPVMVWIHGGAYLVGSSSSDWHRADALAAEGDVVVVRANYRLGVFGYLAMPGVSPANLGVMDHVAALRWVQRNIGAFGGDPGRVTVFGESAGAHAIATLMSTAETRGLFQRAILQSGHLGVGFTSRATAARVAELLRRALGGVDPRRASAEELLAAQQEVVIRMSRPAGMNSTPAFGPIAGEAPVPEGVTLTDAPSRFHPEVDLVIGTTRDEMRAFFDSNPTIALLRRVPGVGQRAFDSLTAQVTRRIFGAPASQLADVQARAGAAIYRYRFDWSPRHGGFGACHTIDLPFTFGDREAWSKAPMLGSTPWEEIDVLGREVRRAWTSFARHGDPSREGGPGWARHRPGDDVGRAFG
jgi:para-nitrobenzyl esterase